MRPRSGRTREGRRSCGGSSRRLVTSAGAPAALRAQLPLRGRPRRQPGQPARARIGRQHCGTWIRASCSQPHPALSSGTSRRRAGTRSQHRLGKASAGTISFSSSRSEWPTRRSLSSRLGRSSEGRGRRPAADRPGSPGRSSGHPPAWRRTCLPGRRRPTSRFRAARVACQSTAKSASCLSPLPPRLPPAQGPDPEPPLRPGSRRGSGRTRRRAGNSLPQTCRRPRTCPPGPRLRSRRSMLRSRLCRRRSARAPGREG
mmetsp:Transcript_16350/g.57138  ORF Transcript_16350/g.57138 Transcript_16350/m.57138 type:complete len:258 (+) Transcript_16350:332-1105(+)